MVPHIKQRYSLLKETSTGDAIAVRRGIKGTCCLGRCGPARTRLSSHARRPHTPRSACRLRHLQEAVIILMPPFNSESIEGVMLIIERFPEHLNTSEILLVYRTIGSPPPPMSPPSGFCRIAGFVWTSQLFPFKYNRGLYANISSNVQNSGDPSSNSLGNP